MPKVFIRNADGSVGKSVDVSNAQAAEAIRTGRAFADDREQYYGTDVDGKQIALNAKEFGNYLDDETTKLRDAGSAREYNEQERLAKVGGQLDTQVFNTGRAAIDMATMGMGMGAITQGASALDALLHKDTYLDGTEVSPGETWRDRYKRNQQSAAAYVDEAKEARKDSYDEIIGGGLGMAATLGIGAMEGAVAKTGGMVGAEMGLTRGTLGYLGRKTGIGAFGAGADALGALGSKIGGSAAGQALTRFGGTWGGKLAAGTLHGAGVGAGFGAGNYLGNEVMLHNRDLSAEKLLGAAGHGAVLGAGFGLGLSGLGVAAGGTARLANRAVRGAGTKAWEGMESGLTRFRRYLKEKGGVAAAESEGALAGESENLAGKSIDELADYFAKGDPDKAKAFKLLGRHGDGFTRFAEAEMDTNARTFGKALDDVLRDEYEITKLMKGQTKLKNISKVIKTDNVAAQMDSTTEVLNAVERTIDEALSVPKGEMGSMAKLRRIKKTVSSIRRKNAELFEKGADDAAERAFKIQDDLKRAIGKEQPDFRPPDGTIEAEAWDIMNTAYHDVQKSLESTELWGDAARLQAEVNAPWSRDIAMTKKVFGRDFIADSGEQLAENARVTMKRAAHNKIRPFLDKVGQSVNINAEDGLRSTIANKRAWLDAAEAHAELTASESAAIAKQRASLDTMEKTFEEAAARTKTINDAKDLLIEEESKKGMLDLMPGLSNLAKFTEKASNMQRIGNYRNVINKFDDGLGKALKALAGAGEGGALADAIGAAKKLDAAAGRVARGAGRAAMTTGEQVNKAILRKLTTTEFDKISDGLQSPRPELQAEVDDLNKLAPGLGDAYGQRVNGAREHLLQHLPKRPTDVLGQTTAPISVAEKREFLRRLGAVSDPANVLDRVRKGTVSPAEIDTLKTVYPKLFADMQRDAISLVAKRGKAMGYQEKMRLGVLLGVPFDRTMSPEFIGKIQGQYQAQAQAKQAQQAPKMPSTSAKKFGRKLLPKSERIGVE